MSEKLDKPANSYEKTFARPGKRCTVTLGTTGRIKVEFETTAGKKGPFPLRLEANTEAGVGITGVTKVTVSRDPIDSKDASADHNTFTVVAI